MTLVDDRIWLIAYFDYDRMRELKVALLVNSSNPCIAIVSNSKLSCNFGENKTMV